MPKKKNYNYNTRNWEKRNGVHRGSILFKESNLTKEEWENLKKEMHDKGTSISQFIVEYLRNYLDKKGGNNNVSM